MSTDIAISYIEKNTFLMGFDLAHNGHRYDIIVGHNHGYNWISFPVLERACTLSFWSDLFWNTEQLSCFLPPIEAQAIAGALIELQRSGYFPN